MMSKFEFTTIAVVVVISLITASCTVKEDTQRYVLNEYHFTIEPDSVLQSIAKGEEEIFTSIDSDSEPNLEYPDPVDWKQSDYVQIVNSFHQFVWGEAIYGWSLNYMTFSMLCSQVGDGFQIASFSFSREQSAGSENFATEHQIDIYPARKLINAWDFAYNSRLAGRKSFEISSVKITAEEALAIAESNGGLENRGTFNNECEISVILSPNSVNYRGWSVVYSLETYSDSFSITVDPMTGKLIK